MTNRLKTILGGAGFYGAVFLCLAAVGAGTYFLLTRDSPEISLAEPAVEPVMEPERLPERPAARPAAPAAEPAKTEPVVETVKPEKLPEPAAEVMPGPVTPVKPDPEKPRAVSAAAAPAPPSKLVVPPLSGRVVAAFSADALTYNPTLDDWRTHDGVDIAAAAGTNVLAASAGTVLSVTEDDLLGTTVVLGHSGGYQTVYANLQEKPTVSPGEKVSAGQIIGAVGGTAIIETATGPHLHFSVSLDGKSVDPDEYLAS